MTLGCGEVGVITSENKPIPDIKKNDFITQKSILNKSLEGKYTMVDFWGTWCGPCVDAIPGLVEIHEMYGDKLQILSVATDKSKDKELLKSIIETNKMTWMHIWDNEDEISKNERLYSKFDVEVFPTVVILDKNATEIARFNGGFFLESRVKKYLKKLDM